jgi:hypothetical protein
VFTAADRAEVVALAYLAAWDVHRGRVTGRCEDTTGIAPFSRLVQWRRQVMVTCSFGSVSHCGHICPGLQRGPTVAEIVAEPGCSAV